MELQEIMEKILLLLVMIGDLLIFIVIQIWRVLTAQDIGLILHTLLEFSSIQAIAIFIQLVDTTELLWNGKLIEMKNKFTY